MNEQVGRQLAELERRIALLEQAADASRKGQTAQMLEALMEGMRIPLSPPLVLRKPN